MTRSGLGSVNRLVPTPFQLKILMHKTGGKTDLAAARALGVAERTIRRQIESLIGSLAVSNRAALFVEVGRRGWLDLISEEELVTGEVTADEPVAAMSA